VVIKNTLALRAVNEAGLVADRLRGPTGLVVAQDPVTAAKVISDFARENDQRPAVKGGMFEGKRVDADQVKRLASMPSREQMLAELGASMQAPMASLLGVLNGLLMTFAGAVDALRAQREGA
jgi:large subunit ribosomal protein L10